MDFTVIKTFHEMMTKDTVTVSDGPRNFDLGGGATSQGVWGTSPSVSWGKAPVGKLGTSPEAEAVCKTLFIDFDCRNDKNLNISHNSPPDS